MNNSSTPSTDDPPDIPVSSFYDTLHQLLSPEALSAPARPGTAGRFDRYEVLQAIGQGGMGVVVLARDPTHRRSVAIKVLREDLKKSPAARKRFLDEAQHMRRLQHPGIVTVLDAGVLDVGEEEGVPWFSMPYFEQGSLAKALAASGPVGDDRAVAIARSAAGALDYAHRHGIIHRDLKPANILLSADGQAVVTDFGLARTVFNDSVVDPQRGHCEGTAPYMSPAVARGEAEDTRCDIYSLGAVLYEMLTGQPPYKGPTSAAVLGQIKAGPPPSLQSLNPRAPDPLVLVIECAMAREARDRYATMQDFLEDLQRIERGERPLGVRPVAQKTRFVEGWRRLPRPVRTLAPFAALAVVLLVSGVWFLRPRFVIDRVVQSGFLEAGGLSRIGHWDDNETPDFFVPVDAGKKWFVVTPEGDVSRGGPFSVPEAGGNCLVFSAPMDVNRDRLDELFVSWNARTNVFLQARNEGNVPIRQYEFPGTTHVRTNRQNELPSSAHPLINYELPRSCTEAAGIADLDGDGKRELLAFLHSSFAHPRGVYCFDLDGQELKWAFPTAATPKSLNTLDINADGNSELIVGLNSSSNIVSLPDGTDDRHSYVLALDGKGRALWYTELAGYFTTAHPLVIARPDQPPLLYAWVGGGHALRTNYGDPEIGFIVRLDPKNGRVIGEHNPGKSIVAAAATGSDGRTPVRILAADRTGRLHLLDEELRLIRQVKPRPARYGDVIWPSVTATNLVPGGEQVFVLGRMDMEPGNQAVDGSDLEKRGTALYHNPTVLVFDLELRERAAYTVGGQSKDPFWQLCVADLDRDGRQEILWLDKSLRVLRLRGWW